MSIDGNKLKASIPFFRDIEPELIERLLPYMYSKTYRKGELIFLEGDQGNEIFYRKRFGQYLFVRQIEEGDSGRPSGGRIFRRNGAYETRTRPLRDRGVLDADPIVRFTPNGFPAVDRE